MLNTFRALILIAIGGMGFNLSAVLAQTGDEQTIRSMLEQRDQEVKAVLNKTESLSGDQKEALRTLVNDVIDFGAMGQVALGKYWAGLTEVQRSEFVDVFGQIVRAQSLADLDPYRAQVTYGRIMVNGTTAKASTNATFKDVKTKVDYDLEKHNGAWHIVDISLDDVSTAKGYARSFQRAIAKRGFDGLMKSLNKRLEKMTQN